MSLNRRNFGVWVSYQPGAHWRLMEPFELGDRRKGNTRQRRSRVWRRARRDYLRAEAKRRPDETVTITLPSYSRDLDYVIVR